MVHQNILNPENMLYIVKAFLALKSKMYNCTVYGIWIVMVYGIKNITVYGIRNITVYGTWNILHITHTGILENIYWNLKKLKLKFITRRVYIYNIIFQWHKNQVD